MSIISRRVCLGSLWGGALSILSGCLGDERGDTEQSIDYDLQKSGHHNRRADEEEIHHDLRWHNDSEQALASIEELSWATNVEQSDVEAFISDTDFDDEELLEIRTSTPAVTEDDIEVETFAYNDEEIWGAAHVITTDEASPAEVGWPTALVRYEVAEDMPPTIRFEITNGGGTTQESTIERE